MVSFFFARLKTPTHRACDQGHEAGAEHWGELGMRWGPIRAEQAEQAESKSHSPSDACDGRTWDINIYKPR